MRAASISAESPFESAPPVFESRAFMALFCASRSACDLSFARGRKLLLRVGGQARRLHLRRELLLSGQWASSILLALVLSFLRLSNQQLGGEGEGSVGGVRVEVWAIGLRRLGCVCGRRLGTGSCVTVLPADDYTLVVLGLGRAFLCLSVCLS